MTAFSADVEDALEFYRFLARDEPDGSARLVTLTIPGKPPSKIRARHGNRRTYADPKDVAAERRTAGFVRAALQGYRFEGNVALGCIFYRPNHQRVDADNMLKHVCDAINGLAFADDSQVTAIAGRVELDRDNPRTVLVLGPHRSSLARGVNDTTPCAVCGAALPLAGRRRGGAARRFCSAACKAAGRPALPPVPCAHCGRPFQRGRTSQTMCSTDCRTASRRGKLRGRAAPRSRCTGCATELTHTRGGRCRSCWSASPKGLPA